MNAELDLGRIRSLCDAAALGALREGGERVHLTFGARGPALDACVAYLERAYPQIRVSVFVLDEGPEAA